MVREQRMTDEVLGHMTSSRLQKRREEILPALCEVSKSSRCPWQLPIVSQLVVAPVEF